MATTIPRERTVVMIAALALSAPVALWLAWPSSDAGLDSSPRGYTSVCPPAPDQPLVVLAWNSRTYDTGHEDTRQYQTDVQGLFATYDPLDGRRRHRQSLGIKASGSARASSDCFAAIGPNVWLWTARDGYHVRDAKSGEMVRSEKELFSSITAPIESVRLDQPKRRLHVATKDGRFYAIDDSFAVTRIEAADTTLPTVPGTWVARSKHVRRRLRGDPSSRGALSQKGQPRAKILVAGKVLAGTDWLQPQYLVHPSSGSLEWPDPPSLIVCEPTELNKSPAQLTRVALDGSILWTYRPGAEHGWIATANLCTWLATGDGSRLVFFTRPNGMIGIDPATGREMFRSLL